jgi:hypothetical protein
MPLSIVCLSAAGGLLQSICPNTIFLQEAGATTHSGSAQTNDMGGNLIKMIKRLLAINFFVALVLLLAVLMGMNESKAAEPEPEEASVITFAVYDDSNQAALPESESDGATSDELSIVIFKYNNDAADIEYLARSVYHSPLENPYEKFKYMNVVYNQKKSELLKEDGSRVYARSIKDLVTNRSEYKWWSDKMPTNETGKRLMTYNTRLAILFLDYITTCDVLQIEPLINRSGLEISFVRDEDGNNRYIEVYDRDGALVEPLFTREQFNELIIKQYSEEYNLNGY